MDTNTVASTCPSSGCAHPLPVPPRGRDVSQLLLDHYQCYEAKPDYKIQKHEVILTDEFGMRTVKLTQPELICTPTVKDPDPSNPVGKFPDDLRNPIDHLVCYDISRGHKDGKMMKDLDVIVQNQFGEHQLDHKKPQLLCVPSLETVLSHDGKKH